MKRQHVFLFVISISLIFFQGANALGLGWENIGGNICSVATPCPSVSYTDFSDVSCTSEDECWVSSSCVNEIYHTTDGGESWEIQHTDYPTDSVEMRDAQNGYAVGAEGFVYRTTDGGAHWTPINSVGRPLWHVSCPPSGQTCYACGDDGTIVSIEGSTVSIMDSGVPDNLSSIHFPISSDEGWVVGGSILDHFTGGAWTADQDRPSGGYNGVFMIDNQTGIVVGDSGLIARTTDGHNWTEVTNPAPESIAFHDVFFLDENKGWAVGDMGLILSTQDGGETWQVVDEVTSNILRRIEMVSSQRGYIAGNQCTLLRFGETGGPENYTLSILKTGSGTVTSGDGNIVCGTACSHSYQEGNQVGLTATPAPGYSFSGWSGDCASCGTSQNCQVTMNGNKTCTAAFSQEADSDGDGVDDVVEDGAPNGGDGNGNGVPDRDEPDVASLPTSTGAGYMTVEASGCNAISQVRSYRAGMGEIPFDSEFTHPYGLVGFEIP